MVDLIIFYNNIPFKNHKWLKRNFTAICKKKKETQDPVINISGFSLFSFQTLKHFTSMRPCLTVSKNVTASIPSLLKTQHIIFPSKHLQKFLISSLKNVSPSL